MEKQIDESFYIVLFEKNKEILAEYLKDIENCIACLKKDSNEQITAFINGTITAHDENFIQRLKQINESLKLISNATKF